MAPGAESEPPANGAQLAIELLDLGGGAQAIVVDARNRYGVEQTIAHWNDGELQLEVLCHEPAAVCRPLVREVLVAALAVLP